MNDEALKVYSAHGADHDHDHDDESPMPLEDNPIWQQDNVRLTSVGIDIGSSGTQILFSRLHLRRIGEDLTSRYIVVKRESLYRSPVALTPYATGLQIDAEALGSIIDQAYHEARVDPESVDTGVVILTGEALRRSNAERIAGILAERGGELVTASAGHNMEARLAAFGSGAARMSYEQDLRILNVDIGGGTTKLAVIEGGRVQSTAAVHVGGRLVVIGPDGRIERLEPAGRMHAENVGLRWEVGDPATDAELDDLAESMAADLLAAALERPLSARSRLLHLTPPVEDLGRIDGILFSGGVSEYIYGQEQRDFSDLGRRIGQSIRRRIDAGDLPYPTLPMGECIRATALGASEYSVQLSGNTGFVSDPEALLPRRNLQVLRPDVDLREEFDRSVLAKQIHAHLESVASDEPDVDVVIALPWRGSPEYSRVRALADAVIEGLADRIGRGLAVYLVLDGDVALTLGRILRDELDVEVPLLVIDGLHLGEFDFIDIGRVRLPSNTVPVTIKSLVFGDLPDHRVSATDG